MHRVHVVWTFFKIGLLNEFAYRANLYLQLIQSCAAGAMAFVGLIVVFGHTDTIGGWGPDEVLAVLGVYLVMGAAISGAIAPSMQKLMEDVRRGTLDYTLTKPEESQFLVSVGEFRVWKLVDAMIGVVVLGVALGRRGETLGAAEAALFGAMMVAGGTIIYSFFLTMGAVSFWFLRIENILLIFHNMYQAARWPIGVYPRWLRIILTFVLPVAIAVTVPAEALLSRLTIERIVVVVLAALFSLTVSRVIWLRGVRHYSGASA
jgi:ABC-2 type transport system permease protein